jgi:hypothetical protein
VIISSPSIPGHIHFAMWGGVNLVAIVVALVAVVCVDGAGFSTHNLAVTRRSMPSCPLDD